MIKKLLLIAVIISVLVVSGVSATAFSPWATYGSCFNATNDTFSLLKCNTTGTHNWLSDGNATTITQYLVVAGGGAGGGSAGGGGGAGGFLNGTSLSVTGMYNITVGAGGARLDKPFYPLTLPTPAGNSTFSNTTFYINATGGGIGGSDSELPPAWGGSGGGAIYRFFMTGNISLPVTDPVQGYSGGNGLLVAPYNGGGGGGAGGPGADGGSGTGYGGMGRASSITGTLETYGIGGRGWNATNSTVFAARNGYGDGGYANETSDGPSYPGGSGVVILLYKTQATPSITSDFTSNVTSGAAPLSVLFTDASTTYNAIIDSWYWIFGDIGVGNTSTLQNPTHMYTASGTYTANLTITNTSLSLVSTKLSDIIVNETLVSDFAGSPLYGFAPQDVAFVDLSVGSDISVWNWSFGDGTVSALRNPTHTYTSEGFKTVTLIVTGADGIASKTEPNYIEIRYKTYSNFTANNTAPIVFEQPVLFIPYLNTSADRYLWDFGDGGSTFLSFNGSAEYIYQSPGPKNVTLTAYRSDNISATNTTTRVAYINPVYNASYVKADFYGNPTSGSAGLLVRFTDTSIWGSTNAVSGRSYCWTFGDGTFSNTVGDVQHVYSSLGTYTVNLSVNNTLGSDFEQKENYIAISTNQMTTWYTPWQVRIRIVDYAGNPLPETTVAANYVATTLPNVSVSWLTSAYGITETVATQMTSSGEAMSGVTDGNGGVSYSMFKSLQYNLTITNTTSGVLSRRLIYPSDQEYVIRVPTGNSPVFNNTLSATANTSLPIYKLNATAYNLSMIYQDTSGMTSNVRFIVKFRNGTVLLDRNKGDPGTGIVVDNYTVLNMGVGKEVLWQYNATRSL